MTVPLHVHMYFRMYDTVHILYHISVTTQLVNCCLSHIQATYVLLKVTTATIRYTSNKAVCGAYATLCIPDDYVLSSNDRWLLTSIISNTSPR